MRELSHRFACWLALFAGAGYLSTLAQEEKPEAPKASPFDQRQIWVPEKDLAGVLATFPRAVLLTPEQYRTLIHDAGLMTAKPEEEAPPVSALVKSVRLEGQVQPEVLTLRAVYEVEGLVDGWAEIPLAMPSEHLASVEVDGRAALRTLREKDQARTVLLVRGKGLHRVEADFILPVERGEEGLSVAIAHPQAPAAGLVLTFPEPVELDAGAGSVRRSPDGREAELTFPGDGAPLQVRWKPRDAAALSGVALEQVCRFIHYLEESRLHADLGLRLRAELKELPNPIVFPLPETAQVLDVEGREVTGWTVEDGRLQVRRQDTAAHQIDLRILLDAPALSPQADEASLALPVLQAEGVFRAGGSLALIGHEGVRLREVSTGPFLTASLDRIDPVIAARPDFLAGFNFSVLSGEPPRVTLRRAEPLVQAALDTRIELRRDGILLERILEVQPKDGRVFRTTITLPQGESLVEVVSASGHLADWTQKGEEIALFWKEPVVPGGHARARVRTRLDPPGWHQLGADPVRLGFASAQVDVEVLSGYVAVESDPAFQLETLESAGLERRDGRRTPVTGQLAWFRLSDYTLSLNVSRRQPEIQAHLTGYALPLTSTLEVEGQLDLTIRHAPIRSLSLQLPAAVVARLRVDSPLVSEQNPDAATGAVTLRFRRELEGAHRLRWHLTLPLPSEGDNGERRFQIAIPNLGLPEASRLTGTWMVEANTDTELAFEAAGLDPLDTLRLPAVEGYQPRHRVLAAYSYRGSDYFLNLSGVRHVTEEMVTTVVDELEIDSVLSTSGVERHQVAMRVRTTGDQFLDLGLPLEAEVISLVVDYEPVKPVEGVAGSVRVRLPARLHPEDAGEIRLIYQTGGAVWKSSGRRQFPRLVLDDAIPVLRTRWRLHLPESFSYREFQTNLSPDFPPETKLLLSHAWDALRGKTEESAGEAVPWQQPQQIASAPATVREKRLAQARQAAQDGDEFAQYRDWLSAAQAYRTALNWITPLEGLSGLKRAYLRQSIDATASLAATLPNQEALELVAGVLGPDQDPKNRIALPVLERLERAELTSGQRERLGRIREALGRPDYYWVLDASPRWSEMGIELTDEIAGRRLFGLLVSRSGEEPQAVRELREKLERIVIPEVEFEETPMEKAIAFFEAKSGELDPLDPRPVKIVFPSIASTAPKPSSGGGPIFDDAGGGFSFGTQRKDDEEARRVTLKLIQVPLLEALRYTTEMANMRFKIEPGQVAIVPLMVSTQPLNSFVYRVPPELADALERKVRDREPVRQAFEEVGISFPAGATAEYDAAANLLFLRNTESQHELVEAWVHSFVESVAYAGENYDPALNDPEEFGIEPSELEMPRPAGPGIEFVQRKLKEIVIPEINFNQTPLREAIDFLRKKSIELDPESDPFRKGVGVVIRGGDDVLDRPITLRLSHVTLAEAYRYTTEMARLKYKVEPTGVIIAPVTELTDDLVTRTFRVPPVLFSQGQSSTAGSTNADPFAAIGGGGGGIQPRKGPKQILEENGISFPPGAAVTYNPDTSTLVVRNTQSQLEMLDAFTQPALSEPAYTAALIGQAPVFTPLPESEAGLQPLDFELPASGRILSFEGLYAPGALQFDYTTWDNQMRRAWGFIALGAIGFWFLAGGRPIYRGAWGIALLSFAPLLFSHQVLLDLTTLANALLLGWLLAMGLILLWNVLRYFQRRLGGDW